MKNYLLTWYGITDLKASLGIENTQGPILNALSAGAYSEVVILAYSNPQKSDVDQETFEKELKEIRNNTALDRTLKINNFINTYSNTELAHNHFIQWLRNQARKVSADLVLSLQPIILQHLNDTEGIYNAATKLLDAAATQGRGILVTFYLSPGTPVMAFVWAFVALKHPHLKKQLIASSSPNNSPEIISLPNEWLEWHGKQLETQSDNNKKFDIFFHLFGEQRLPNLLGILQFAANKHVFINSEKYPAGVMKQFMGNAQFDELFINPFDPEDVRSTIVQYLSAMPKNLKVGFNLTGGTKLMYAGALAACKKNNATPYYFENNTNNVINLNNFKIETIKPITSVETFIKLNRDDLRITKPGSWDEIPNISSDDRLALTQLLWTERAIIRYLYRELSKFTDKPEVNFSVEYKGNGKNITASLINKSEAEVRINNKIYKFSHWPDFAAYLCGGWFEEYTYLLLKPFVNTGYIYDLRIGLELSFKNEYQGEYNKLYQELDIVFTDGRNLYIIECKAGSVKSDHIMKLQNITGNYGGNNSQGILAACFPPSSSAVKKKVADSNNICLITGKWFPDELESFIKK